VTACAALYFVAAVWVVIPHYNGGQSPFMVRYGAYGDGAGDIVKTALSDPGRIVADLTSASNLGYWLELLWPFGFLPLLSPLTALQAAPDMLLNALSSTRFQREIEFHYTATIIPVLFAAVPLGLMRLWRWLAGGFRRPETALAGERIGRETLALLVLLVALAGNYFLGPLPFSLPYAAYGGRAYSRDAHAAALDEAVALIPDGAVVSVNNNAGAQLSARRTVYVFPYFAKAEYVLVDERHPFFYDREDQRMHRLALGRLVLDNHFRSIYAKDGVYVFQRYDAGPAAPAGAGPAATPSPGPSATPQTSLIGNAAPPASARRRVLTPPS
jgi:uncharacterized membrane protein